MQVETVFAGFGGQGVLLAGKILAEVGMAMGREVVWLPSYGPEMRGGTANCTVIIADRPIASPIVSSPRDAVVMNRPSLEKFAPALQPGGFVVVNTSLISVKPERRDLTVVEVPANEIAIEAGAAKAANMTMLGAYVAVTEVVTLEALLEQARHEFAKKPRLVPVNVACIEKGFALGTAARKQR